MKIKSPIGFLAVWSAFLAVGPRFGRLSLTLPTARCVSIAFAAACVSLGGVEAEAQLNPVPPEITRPTYAIVDEAFFETKFGTSFTNGDVLRSSLASLTRPGSIHCSVLTSVQVSLFCTMSAASGQAGSPWFRP